MTTTPSITLYAKPHGCVQCDAVKRTLNKAGFTPQATTQTALDSKTDPAGPGLIYDVIDVTEDDEGRAKVKNLNYLQAPVTVWVDCNGKTHHRSGNVPGFVKAAIADLQATTV